MTMYSETCSTGDSPEPEDLQALLTVTIHGVDGPFGLCFTWSQGPSEQVGSSVTCAFVNPPGGPVFDHADLLVYLSSGGFTSSPRTPGLPVSAA
jgi:hypothetical protein